MRVWLAVTVAIASSPAWAQTPGLLLDAAREALARGDLDVAAHALDAVNPAQVDRNDLEFLQGMLAFARHDLATAIVHYKAVLNRDHKLNRVRLELARAYFEKGDDVAAEHYFRAAAAQGVPPNVQRNIDRFLDLIRRRKHWTAAVSASVVPDSNINAATAAPTVDLFGLPFELMKTAQQTSGVGFATTLLGGYQWDLTSNTKLKVGAAYNGTEYSDEAFSDRNLSGYIGPRFLVSEGSELSVLATASRRWYGGDSFTHGAGGRIEGQTALSPRWLLSGAVDAQEVWYDAPGYEGYSGPVVSLESTLTYALNAQSFLRANGGIVREQAEVAGLRNIQYVLGVGAYRENLPGGFGIFASVQGSLANYDSPLAVFGFTRHDSELDYRVTLSNRHVEVFGFTPLVSFVRTDRYSNISLYEYHRNRGELGVIRAF